MKSLIIYFSRADENYAVGYIDKGNTEIVAEYVQNNGLAIKGSQAKNAKAKVQQWL